MTPSYELGAVGHRFGPLPAFPRPAAYGPPQPEPNTPDYVGYIWAAFIAIAFDAGVASLPILVALAWAIGPFAIIAAILYYPGVFAIVTAAVAPLALLSTWLTHIVVRRVRYQVVHVLVAGVFGWFTAELYVFLPIEASTAQLAAVVVGFGAATGRLCMIEHVHKRRYLASIGRLPRSR